MPELTLAHSPDSDDLVMWWPICGMTLDDGSPMDGPMGSPAIDTGGFVFRPMAEDVEVLNRRAIEVGDLDITAISAHTYPHIKVRYRITDCGGSFGEGYGPKVVVREGDPRFADGVAGLLEDGVSIAVPGLKTSAFLALSLLLREIDASRPVRAVEMPFQEIIAAVQRGDVDAGLLIHEAQLTFADAGLRKVVDLGQWWGGEDGSPLPLGLNVIRRDLDDRFGEGTCRKVSRILSESVRYAVEHESESRAFLKMRGEGRPEWNDEALVNTYLSMYVSGLTRSMGSAGIEALRRLLGAGAEAGLCPDPGEIDVV
ncbi:MAG TPA: ABC transporter substrate-binding protein [Phycisphaerales bacterium]|nr:ABC transporter substrate-binding protein [Phycisphaerales bacterium]